MDTTTAPIEEAPNPHEEKKFHNSRLIRIPVIHILGVGFVLFVIAINLVVIKDGPYKRWAQLPPKTYTIVSQIVDGNTIRVPNGPGIQEDRINGGGSSHRTIDLLGVAAPSLSTQQVNPEPECGALEATRELTTVIRPGDLIHIITDPGIEQVRGEPAKAYIEVAQGSKQIDLGAHMISKGLATANYDQSRPTPERFAAYQELEDEAKAAKRGSWTSCGESFGG